VTPSPRIAPLLGYQDSHELVAHGQREPWSRFANAKCPLSFLLIRGSGHPGVLRRPSDDRGRHEPEFPGAAARSECFELAFKSEFQIQEPCPDGAIGFALWEPTRRSTAIDPERLGALAAGAIGDAFMQLPAKSADPNGKNSERKSLFAIAKVSAVFGLFRHASQ
jgi:hypothetical protein